MKPRFREATIVLILVIAGVILHIFSARWLSFNVSLPLFISVLLPWTLPRPIPYLVPLIVVSELLTTAPFGITTVALLTPLLIRTIGRRIELNISFNFLLILATTCASQLLIVNSFDAITYGGLPYTTLVATWAAITVVCYSTAIAVMDILPIPQRSVISLEGYKVHGT